jgi:hypothetical protein
MRALGFLIVFFGWLTSMGGYTFGHLATIALGLLLIIGGGRFAR